MNRKDVLSGWIKNLFLYGVIGFMAYTTWNAVMLATENVVLASLSLFLFDGGAYAGYRMLVGDAEGAPQRSAAQVVLWADFLLAGAMVAGALEILPPNTIRYVMLVSAVFNGWALYYYETHRPETLEQMQEQDEKDSITEAARNNRKKLHREAMRQADANISRQAIQLGTLLSLRATSQLKFDMRLPMTEDERKAFEDDIIDVQALPAPADMPIQQQLGFVDFLKGLFTRGPRMPLQNTHSQQDAPLLSEQQNPEPVSQDNPQ
jgi:hypothetical protein